MNWNLYGYSMLKCRVMGYFIEILDNGYVGSWSSLME